MTRASLNKSVLSRESVKLSEYQRFLPSLELKRRQIVAERLRARAHLAECRAQLEAQLVGSARDLPMLANEEVALDTLVVVEAIDLSTQNLSGTRLPVLKEVRFAEVVYARLTRPHWVDAAVVALREVIRMRIARDVAERRLRELEQAEALIARRVNLFEKVLIPRSQETIRRIRMALADAEREAVIRAKLSKRKTAARAGEARLAAI
ncbi:V-type ATP synthase subunit D [Stappia sp. ES.058]|uniref:V-type ATP synthase subunit D n=1 Tax=Stappia sp. ES.058 TaxID=1881061 RepID=UPI000879A382|nr:V-type ATP synthase subunit D [Stappia sp. ES.058]SDU02717.1 V/A-type H+-transporting ATPase subunit D [Stappia sp. ES.058]